MEREKLKSILESLLFASERPLGVRELRGVVEEVDAPELVATLGELAQDYQARGFALLEVAGGYQFRTNPENAAWVRRLLGAKPMRLSRAALETLAVIAYRQPVTRAEIEDVRGVDSGGVLKVLLERRLVKILGKKEEIGRPMLYGTSKEFLEFFGLKDLKQLPTLREFRELSEESMQKLDASGLGGDAPAANDAAVAAEPAVAEPEATPAEPLSAAEPAGE